MRVDELVAERVGKRVAVSVYQKAVKMGDEKVERLAA